MNAFSYYMPTEVLFGRDCVIQQGARLKELGSHALIVTGRSSKQNAVSIFCFVTHVILSLNGAKLLVKVCAINAVLSARKRMRFFMPAFQDAK